MRIPLSILLLFGNWTLFGAREHTCYEITDAVPLCTILANPNAYDGKEITVRGSYRMVLHGSVLTASECAQTYVNMREAGGYRADKRALKVIRSATKKDQFQPVEVIVRGMFHSARQGECFGQNCLRYEIEDRELLCAEVPGKAPAAKKQH